MHGWGAIARCLNQPGAEISHKVSVLCNCIRLRDVVRKSSKGGGRFKWQFKKKLFLH